MMRMGGLSPSRVDLAPARRVAPWPTLAGRDSGFFRSGGPVIWGRMTRIWDDFLWREKLQQPAMLSNLLRSDFHR